MAIPAANAVALLLTRHPLAAIMVSLSQPAMANQPNPSRRDRPSDCTFLASQQTRAADPRLSVLRQEIPEAYVKAKRAFTLASESELAEEDLDMISGPLRLTAEGILLTGSCLLTGDVDRRLSSPKLADVLRRFGRTTQSPCIWVPPGKGFADPAPSLSWDDVEEIRAGHHVNLHVHARARKRRPRLPQNPQQRYREQAALLMKVLSNHKMIMEGGYVRGRLSSLMWDFEAYADAGSAQEGRVPPEYIGPLLPPRFGRPNGSYQRKSVDGEIETGWVRSLTYDKSGLQIAINHPETSAVKLPLWTAKVYV